MKQFKGIEEKINNYRGWFSCPENKIKSCSVPVLGDSYLWMLSLCLVVAVTEGWLRRMTQWLRREYWAWSVLGSPPCKAPCLLHRQTCSWCMPPSAAVFVSSPPAPCFSWHIFLDLLCCPCTSYTNTQLWSHKPSLEHRKINGSLLQRFLAAVSIHLADKRPFSPASLDVYLASSCW